MTEAIIALVVLFVLALLGWLVREKPRDGTSLTWTYMMEPGPDRLFYGVTTTHGPASMTSTVWTAIDVEIEDDDDPVHQ